MYVCHQFFWNECVSVPLLVLRIFTGALTIGSQMQKPTMAYAGLVRCGVFGLSSVCLKRQGQTLVGPSPSRPRWRASDMSDSEDELFLAATAAATEHGQCALWGGKQRHPSLAAQLMQPWETAALALDLAATPIAARRRVPSVQ